MKIGPISLSRPLVLASMEEHTNYAFRALMKQFGAGLVRSERVDAADVARRDRRALRVLYTAPDEAPRAGQISGADPAVMAEAARVVEELHFDLVDLNFECPIRRLIRRGEGGALMADPPAIARIVDRVVKAVNIPVTLKIRSGPDADRETAAEVARRAQDAGTAAVEVHARNVAQAYVGGPDWSVVSRVKRHVGLPVLASGGIRQASDVRRLLDETGADAAAVARGCLGNPWIFREARALLSGAAAPTPPTPADRGRALVRLVEAEFRLYGPTVALRRLPRTSCYFAKFVPDFAAFRSAVQKVENLPQFRRLVKDHFRAGFPAT
jgi:tRNA-dihydrouridine synthase B